MTSIKIVVSGGYCIGCGACSLGNGVSKIALDPYGRFQAELPNETHLLASADTVCPFGDEVPNEEALATELFSAKTSLKNPIIGRYISLWAGHVVEVGYQERGSSGGFTSWVLSKLLSNGHVDAVVHVKPCNPTINNPMMFKYGISRSANELNSGAKSHYYPVEMSQILQQIRNTPGRYALVGVPCFIKAVRLLCRQEKIFQERILFSIGLFCGHLKSTGFAELLGWQAGIAPKNLTAINFRTKLPDRAASDYGVTATGNEGGRKISKTKPMSEMIGTDWGMGLFKYDACDYCDDISAETADVSVGDAWLPEYNQDYRGTNIIVIRHPLIQSIVLSGIENRSLALHTIPIEKIITSQSANVKHRKVDIAYRLHLKKIAGLWFPPKRVEPKKITNVRRRRVQEFRIRFRQEVPALWSKTVALEDFSFFSSNIKPLIEKYQKLYAPNYSILTRAKLLIYRLRIKCSSLIQR